MLNNIYETVKFFLNKDKKGNFTPTDFNLAVNFVVGEKYDLMLHEVNKLINRQNRGLINGGLENTVELLRQKIEHYLESATVSAPALKPYIFTLPSDLRYFDSVLFGDEIVEMLKSYKEYTIAKTTTPSEEYPVGLKQGNTVTILPTTISTVTVNYLRSPLEAKWTYSVVGGEEIYNPSATDYNDVDIHESEKEDIIIRVLEKFGVNLSEKEIMEYAKQEETTDFQIKNQV